jgi:hypothetical protein
MVIVALFPTLRQDSRLLLSSGADGGIFSWNLQQQARREAAAVEAIRPIIPAQVLPFHLLIFV